MFVAHEPLALLGSGYREHDYSPTFHSMVNRVVSKIYRRKGRRKPIFASICNAPASEEEEKPSVMSPFAVRSNRKNSPNPLKFFSATKNGKI
jgi:hypothetical protein